MRQPITQLLNIWKIKKIGLNRSQGFSVIVHGLKEMKYFLVSAYSTPDISHI